MGIAIDFGTSNTVITRWNRATQQPETLFLPGISQRTGQNPPLIPSLLYVEDASRSQVLVGQAVRDRGLDLSRDPRFFRNFKRGIGASVQGFMPELDGQAIGFEQAGQWFLTQVITQLQAIEPEAAESLTFTVPVDSFEAYRLWLGGVCTALNVEQVRMVDEPTAAALGYGMADSEILLVIDFGGGTLDLSLVQLRGAAQPAAKPTGFLLKWGKKSFAEQSGQQVKTARVLAKAGLNLGGSDLDNWLVDHFAATQGLAVSPLTLRLAERLKIQLSLQTQAQEVYFDDATFDSYDLQLSREQFEAILAERQFFAGVESCLEQVWQQAQRQGLAAADVDAVLLVGGTAQIPAVQQWVRQYFGDRNFDPAQIRCEKPFEAIAQGALQITQGVELQDFLYHSYGVRYWDRRNNCHAWHPIIKTGQPYPMGKPVELFLGASVENQPSVELVIGELGGEAEQTEVYFDGDRLITRRIGAAQPTVQPLNDRAGARSIAKLEPPGFPGSDRVKVYFRVDEQRFLRITVEDLLAIRTLVEDQPVVQLS
jgi:molecular chaperone DnaK (HSP70)